MIGDGLPAIVNWLNDIVVAGQGNGLAYYPPSFTNTQWMLCWIPSLRAEVVLCHIVVTEPAPLPPRLARTEARCGPAPKSRSARRKTEERRTTSYDLLDLCPPPGPEGVVGSHQGRGEWAVWVVRSAVTPSAVHPLSYHPTTERTSELHEGQSSLSRRRDAWGRIGLCDLRREGRGGERRGTHSTTPTSGTRPPKQAVHSRCRRSCGSWRKRATWLEWRRRSRPVPISRRRTVMYVG